jgi:hypothetical protein
VTIRITSNTNGTRPDIQPAVSQSHSLRKLDSSNDCSAFYLRRLFTFFTSVAPCCAAERQGRLGKTACLQTSPQIHQVCPKHPSSCTQQYSTPHCQLSPTSHFSFILHWNSKLELLCTFSQHRSVNISHFPHSGSTRLSSFMLWL